MDRKSNKLATKASWFAEMFALAAEKVPKL